MTFCLLLIQERPLDTCFLSATSTHFPSAANQTHHNHNSSKHLKTTSRSNALVRILLLPLTFTTLLKTLLSAKGKPATSSCSSSHSHSSNLFSFPRPWHAAEPSLAAPLSARFISKYREDRISLTATMTEEDTLGIRATVTTDMCMLYTFSFCKYPQLQYRQHTVYTWYSSVTLGHLCHLQNLV